MAFVPCTFFGNYGRLAAQLAGVPPGKKVEVRRAYVPIFAIPAKSEIDVARLMLNIAFAALAGGLIAYLSPSLAGAVIAHKRAVILCGIALATAVVGWGVYEIRQSARLRAHSDEKYAADLLNNIKAMRQYWGKYERADDDLAIAREKLKAAADNWFIACEWQNEKRARSQAESIFDPSTAVLVEDFDPDAFLANKTPKPRDIFDDLVPAPSPASLAKNDNPSPTAAGTPADIRVPFSESTQSTLTIAPYRDSAYFAKIAMELRERARLQSGPQVLASSTSRTSWREEIANEPETKPARTSPDADVDFQGFVGRLKKAVAAHDANTLASMMTEDFTYVLGATEAEDRKGDGVFEYWDEHGLWMELDAILTKRFVKKGEFWVAPPQFAVPSLHYTGYRAGICRVGGSWKFVYFVNG